LCICLALVSVLVCILRRDLSFQGNFFKGIFIFMYLCMDIGYFQPFFPVMRIRIRDPGLFDPWTRIRDPEQVFSGSRIPDPNPIFFRA
jgi:hypothetical protein